MSKLLVTMLAIARRPLFDNEPTGDDTGAGGGGTPPAQKTPASKSFTQDEVNSILARERKTLQTQNQTLVAQLETIQQAANTTAEQRAELETQIEKLRATFTTDAERAAQQAKKLKDEYDGKLKSTEESAKSWQSRYAKAEIGRAISDAAVAHKARRAELIAAVLQPMTQIEETIGEDGKPTGEYAPVVNFEDINAEGKPVVLKLRVNDAVKRMRELPDLYGVLFDSDVAGGAGGSAPNSSRGKGGKINPMELAKQDPAAYAAYRKKNPGEFGLVH